MDTFSNRELCPLRIASCIQRPALEILYSNELLGLGIILNYGDTLLAFFVRIDACLRLFFKMQMI